MIRKASEVIMEWEIAEKLKYHKKIGNCPPYGTDEYREYKRLYMKQRLKLKKIEEGLT